MPQITSTGIGSGLDISGLVTQLVQAEGAPQERRLNINESRAQSRLSAYGSLKGALTTFQSALGKLQSSDLFLSHTAKVSDSELFSVTADAEAAAGNYSIQAEKLASRHKLASAAFASDDTSIGTGTMSFSINGESFSVTIDDTNDTLAGIRDAINNASDNVGLSAAIIRDENGSRLVFTADETGAANAISITASTTVDDTGDLTQLSYDPNEIAANNALTEKSEAADAVLIIDGFTAKSATNKFENVIDGVTINLLAAGPGQAESLSITEDEKSVKSAINQFVSAYNALRSTLNSLTAYDPDSGAAGPLQGDSTASRLSTQLRQSLNDTVRGADASLDTLAEIGITTNPENGTLEVDNDKLSELIDSNFEGFATLFSGDNGLANRLDTIAEVYTRFEGLLDSRSAGLKSQIDRISDQRETLNRRLQSIEARYLQQFNALDALLSDLNQTSNFLSSQLANLPGFTRSEK